MTMLIYPTPIAYESITVSNTALGFTAATMSGATSALISIEDDNIRVRFDGTDPTAGEGHLLFAGQTQLVEGRTALSQFRMIRVTADATVKVTYFSVGV
jgi:hypothetical protein